MNEDPGSERNSILTLKAFANSSLGFALKPWVLEVLKKDVRNSEGVAKAWIATQLFQSCVSGNGMTFPRVAKAQPRAGISERFQR
jgi:hypothetical protein